MKRGRNSGDSGFYVNDTAKEILLVDGYNVIFSWSHLKKLSEFSLSSAREKLIETLANYQGFKKNEVIVVFDAHKVKGSTIKPEKYNGIHVVYTKQAVTADHFIERVVKKATSSYRVRVVTSDALEQMIILGAGAIRVSSSEFLAEISSTENKIRTEYTENRPPKMNMLIDNLDPKTAEWFKQMGRGDI